VAWSGLSFIICDYVTVIVTVICNWLWLWHWRLRFGTAGPATAGPGRHRGRCRPRLDTGGPGLRGKASRWDGPRLDGWIDHALCFRPADGRSKRGRPLLSETAASRRRDVAENSTAFGGRRWRTVPQHISLVYYMLLLICLSVKVSYFPVTNIDAGVPPVTARTTRSLSSHAPRLAVPRTRTVFASRVFSVAASTVWNSLPDNVVNSESRTP